MSSLTSSYISGRIAGTVTLRNGTTRDAWSYPDGSVQYLDARMSWRTAGITVADSFIPTMPAASPALPAASPALPLSTAGTGLHVVSTASVCQSCMLTEQQGECPPDLDQSQPLPWSRVPGSEQLAWSVGVVDHADHCDRWECECAELGFRDWSRCDACGSTLAGDRFAYVILDR